MPSICFYFQVHQPYRMRPFKVFEIGKNQDYFDEKINKEICKKVAEKCYLPTNQMMLELIQRYPGKFKIAYSISGVALEQFAEYTPEVLESFQRLVASGGVEIIEETYFHSLSALFNAAEFKEQVRLHRQTVKHHFGVEPLGFRNTELIYSNGIADMVEDLGYQYILTEGADHVLGWRSPNFVYEPWNGRGMKLLLKNYKLSDDIAFRFSQRSWKDWPLTTEKFAGWVQQVDGCGDTINLFMDYETFGEHQWADSGIFDFMRHLPEAIWNHTNFSFDFPSEVIKKYPPIAKIDVPNSISWADTERDLSAWLGNPMQDDSIAWVYRLDQQVKELGDPHILHQWRKLQTSDHFYYMCTKYWSDGDVHKYFSVYDSPHNSYTIMGNILTDLELKLKNHAKPKRSAPKVATFVAKNPPPKPENKTELAPPKAKPKVSLNKPKTKKS